MNTNIPGVETEIDRNSPNCSVVASRSNVKRSNSRHASKKGKINMSTITTKDGTRAPHGLCTTHKDLVNADLLGFIEEAQQSLRKAA